MLHQVGGQLGRAALRQILRRCDTQTAVVGHAHADQRRIGQIAHAHGAIKTFTREIHHPVAEVERNLHVGVQRAKARHQRRHVAPPKACRRRDAQVPAGLDATRRHAGLGIGYVREHALAILKEGAAFVRQADAARGAHQELDAQVLLQGVEPPAHDGGRHAFGPRRRREAATRGNRDERLEGLEFVHGGRLWRQGGFLGRVVCKARLKARIFNKIGF